MKGKAIRSFFMLSALLVSSARAQENAAKEDRFNALTKAIAPVLALLTPSGSDGNHALNFEATVAQISGLPPQLMGARVHLAFEFPDKLFVQAPTPLGDAILCRDGQTVWAWPASQFAPLVEKIGATISTQPLPSFEIDAKKAVLLPALFDVHDVGLVKFGDQNYRVLDLRLIFDEVTKKHADGYPVRVWIRPTDHHLAQIAWRQKDWSVTLNVQQMDFAPSLPSTTWQPTAAQHDQVMAVPGEKIATLLQLALKQTR